MTDLYNERRRLTSHFGATLRQARQKLSLTQMDVAERIGLATDVFGRIERGSMLPRVPTLRKLCRVLRQDANILLGLDSETAPSWLEVARPEAEEPPELRRVMRMLRQMDAAQLAVVSSTASALLKHMSRRPKDPSR